MTALLAAISATVLAAGVSGVDNVTVASPDGSAQINIEFSCPNRMLEHFPQGETDVLQISLLRSEQCTSLQQRSDRQEVNIPGNSAMVALASIEYESQLEDEAVLRIRFEHSVRVVVSQFGDQRLLSIEVDTSDAVAASKPVYLLADRAIAGNDSSRVDVTTSGAAIGDRPLSEAQLVSLMAEGEAAILEENYSRAVQIYTRVLRAPENIYSPHAQELLGVSQERNSHTTLAVAEYRRYLEHYPNHEGAGRVRQRLAGLVTARWSSSPGSVGNASRTKSRRWDIYGGISQYYRRDEITLEGLDTITAQSSILTAADLSMRRRGERMEISGRASLGNMWDLLADEGDQTSQTRLYQGFIEIQDKVTGLGARLGRQSLRSSGVLGRFDGLHMVWEFKPGMRFNLMGGYPVDTTADGLETNRHFYGAAIDFEQVADLIDVSFFYNRQEFEGLKNREAVGSSLRYFGNSVSLTSLIDYDIGFNKLNSLALLGNWKIRPGTTISASINHRTSPFLTTRNALIGQRARTIEELLLTYSEDEIRELAESRSGQVTSYRLGASQTISERFHLNADFSMMEYDGSPASAGADGVPYRDTQYYYSINLVGSRLFMDGDTSILGLRHADSDYSATSTFSLDSRFPVSRNFQINPRLRVSYRDGKTFGSDAWTTYPSLRLLFRIGRRYRLDFEAGGQWVNQKGANNNSLDRSSWFLYCGYRADF